MFVPVVVFDGLPSAALGGAAPFDPGSITVTPGLPLAGIGSCFAHGESVMIDCASFCVHSLKSLPCQGPLTAASSVAPTAASIKPLHRIHRIPALSVCRT